ncbi:MAG TPA: glycosyltransferase 87 family protein [Gaiellaceae bacterium]|nr:glycosyltransferase 87 family protein [Gaiellaceae bacterium]
MKLQRLRRFDLEESRWGGPWLALAGVLVLAAALRLVGIRNGLPFPLLNPDERNIVPRAWAMVHGGGADPNWFDYPSLVLYLLAPFQWWHDEPSYLTARVVVVALGVGGVAAAWWLGSRAYGTLAGFVAASATAVETTHVAYSRMAVTDIALTLGVAVALALMVTGRIELAGLAAGLATSAKYPGLFLLAPLVAAAWGRWWRLAAAAGLAVLAFALTSPYVILDLGRASEDAWRVQQAARDGWLGFENDHAAPIAFVDRLWDGFGPALLIALAGLVLALVRRTRADLVLAAFCLVYFADLLTLEAHFDRYVLPLVPALGALAGRIRSLAPVTLLLLLVPLTWSIRDARELTKTDARVVAHRWIEDNLPKGARIAVDPSTPDLTGYRVLHLLLPRPGEPSDGNRRLEALRDRRIRYVVLTGAVEDRVFDARDEYPHETRFVEDMRREATRIYSIRPDRDLGGHWVEVYRLS